LIALTVARVLNPDRNPKIKSQPAQILPRAFWIYVVAAGLLACGYVDFPLLAYRFESANLFSPAGIPILYVLAMAVNGITALMFGRMFDRFGLNTLVLGILISLLAVPLGFLGGTAAAVASIVCWATGLGAQDACLRSAIATVISMNKRGTAFGIFNGVYGVMWFFGSLVMGLLYAKSPIGLAVFGVAAQAASAILFFRLRGMLAPPQ
jgi:MFS-type transporter involved in bile tolerance (Atg22 family)